MPAGNPGDSVEPSAPMSSFASLNEDSSSLADGRSQAPILVAVVGDRSSGTTTQQGRTIALQTAASPSDTGRKRTSTVRKANAADNTSGSSTISTGATTQRAPVSAIMPNLPILNMSTATQIGSSAAAVSTSIAKQIDARTPDSNSGSSAVPAATPALAARLPQGGEAAATVDALLHAPGISTGASIVSHNPDMLHGTQTIDSRFGVSSNSDATQNCDSSWDAGASQPTFVGGAVSAHAGTNGSASIASDASLASSVGAHGIGNPGSVANDAVGNAGNGAAASVHVNDGSKRSDFTAATPPTAAKDLPISHANLLGSSVGSQNGASVFSAGSHSGTPASFSSSTAASTAARATTADAFTALDSATVGERGVLLHAAPHQVAVGVTDPLLGWVEVRAERVSGQIAAALTTSSAASHEALTSVLPTMATYLREHQPGVQQVHVESLMSNGQAGTGSQGQASPQNQAHTAADNTPPANAATSSRNAVPVGNTAGATNHKGSFIKEGHRFSIRA